MRPFFFFFSSRRRHTRFSRDWSSDVCSSDLGEQREYPDSWRLQGSPWLIAKRDETLRIPVYGAIEKVSTGDDLRNTRWTQQQILLGAPDDLPIVSFGGRTVNVLRLYSALASDEFDIGIFHQGDYQ